MSLFSRRMTVASTGILAGFRDRHSHILPGVDDGIRSLSDSLSVLSRYASLGVTELWLTPHVMEDCPNTTSRLRSRFEELCGVYTGSVVLHLAAEYMMDGVLEERLELGDLLPLGNAGDHLLVETSYYSPPADLHGILGRVRSAGFFPVLAHPERYLYMEMGEYGRLAEGGTVLQLNLPSLAGMYGDAVRRRAVRLLESGLYGIAGTDLHRPGQLDTLLQSECLGRREAGLLRDYRFMEL